MGDDDGVAAAAGVVQAIREQVRRIFPAPNPSNRQASMYNPKTGKFELIYTCFGTHHLQFSEKQEMLYFSGGGATIPWVNVKTWEATKNEQQSTGWCPTVIDTNGDGKITKPWNEPVGGGRSQEEGGGGGRLGTFDAKLDTRVNAGSYGIVASPTDDSVWSAGTGYPVSFTRLELGANPPETCKAEIYTIPDDKAQIHFGPRGIDIDRNGVAWAALSGSGGFVSFDRRKPDLPAGLSFVAVLVDAEGECLGRLRPEVVVDARMAKRRLDTRRGQAPLVVGLGPGFTAGQDVHAVVETQRGDELGRVLWSGSAQADTARPAPVLGVDSDRVLRAPRAGTFLGGCRIGALVPANWRIGEVEGVPITARVGGLVRGLLHDGVAVEGGTKVGDIDPRGVEVDPARISDKGRTVAGGVLEAVLTHFKGRF